MTRRALMVTAVATVTIPGLLAVMAIRAHEHVAAASVSAAALNGVTTPEGTKDSGGVAEAQRAPGASVATLGRPTASQQAMGKHLLDSAADASQATSYQGTELVSQSGVAGSVKMVSQVWHEGGGPTLVEAPPGTPSPVAQPTAKYGAAAADPASGSPDGVFGLTKNLVTQLGKHYVAVYQGHGSAAGKSASVVNVYRLDGSVAARYWLDGHTKVPLRRELFDTADKVVSEDSFVQVKFGVVSQPLLAGKAAAELRQAKSSWVSAAPAAEFRAALTGQGWQVPATLPGGLPLYAAASATTTSGQVVELEYSDGLYVVSLFVQRGTLAPDMSGWQRVSLAGRQAFASGHSVTWAGSGFVYTVIADAPPQTVAQVVQALPGGGSPGVLDRMGRGFMRLAGIMNPFG